MRSCGQCGERPILRCARAISGQHHKMRLTAPRPGLSHCLITFAWFSSGLSAVVPSDHASQQYLGQLPPTTSYSVARISVDSTTGVKDILRSAQVSLMPLLRPGITRSVWNTSRTTWMCGRSQTPAWMSMFRMGPLYLQASPG